METSKFVLRDIRVAAPCDARWDEMTGDERQRRCALCKLDVFNLSAMTAEEAVRFVQQAQGRTCVRLYVRADGTVLTKDCPVGLAAVRRRIALALSAAAALVVAGMHALGDRVLVVGPWVRAVRPEGSVSTPQAVMGNLVMGEMVMGKMTVAPSARKGRPETLQ
jgi:hypothetical protein